MLRTTDMTTTKGGEQFYPTPPSIAEKMLEGLDYRMISSVLEPSAGKGDLVSAYLSGYMDEDRYAYRNNFAVDVCEIDPYLRQICKYNFSREAHADVYDELSDLRRRSYTDEERKRERELDKLTDLYDMGKCVRIVHDDFLTYRTAKHYDLILMNPPFAKGAEHLMKAIQMQETGGGAIICLLNAETLRNPCTPIRLELAKKLQELDAQVEYLEDAFSAADAERKARVDCAIVRIHILTPEAGESEIWERMKKAAYAESMPDPELKALVSGDSIEQAIQLYNAEVAATMDLVRQYNALIPYMPRRLGSDDKFDKTPILTLTVGDDSYLHGFDLNKYLRTVRMKYWNALFENKEFTGKLTSALQKKFRETVDRMAEYEFSAFNIKQVALEMQQAMREGIEQEILHLFDELTCEHSWYPECNQNRHYYNGWASNKAHKIGKKCILPVNGMFSSYSWHGETFDGYAAYGYISDLEKAFDYLDAQPLNNGYNLSARLRWANQSGQTRNIELKYFKIDLYKKGTVHIKFLPEAMPLVERLNIYASRKKNWLPPNYGKASYSNMAAEEKAVVDSFHGDGSDGSGAEAYSEVMSKAGFYLAEPVNKLQALSS